MQRLAMIQKHTKTDNPMVTKMEAMTIDRLCDSQSTTSDFHEASSVDDLIKMFSLEQPKVTSSAMTDQYVMRMEIVNAEDSLDFLVERKIVTSLDRAGLIAMIHAVDPRDFDMAKMIIALKMKEVYKQSRTVDDMLKSPDEESRVLGRIITDQLTKD